jgi:hypothetical protein
MSEMGPFSDLGADDLDVRSTPINRHHELDGLRQKSAFCGRFPIFDLEAMTLNLFQESGTGPDSASRGAHPVGRRVESIHFVAFIDRRALNA